VPGTIFSKNEKMPGHATKVVIKGARYGEEELYGERLA